jgi:4-hydroxybenzoate polyprenyltransferase
MRRGPLVTVCCALLVVLAAYALPYLFVLAVPVVGIALGYRRARRRLRR